MRVPTALAQLTSTLFLATILAASEPAPTDATTTPPAPPPEPVAKLTLEDAVRMAVQNNLTLVAERYNRETSREAVVVADSAFDPVLGLTSRRSFSQQQSSSTLDGAINPTNDSVRTSGTAAEKIVTGATVTLTTDLSRGSTNSSNSRINPQFDSDISLNIRQPLLNGGGRTVVRIPRRRAVLGVERSDIAYVGRALDVVRDTELAFFDLASAQQQLEVQRGGLDAAQRFLDENEARREAGLATELDIMQARVGVANRRSSIISAEQRVHDATDALLALLGRTDFSGSVEPEGVTFGPVDPVSVERSYGVAIQNDTDIASARKQIEQFELDVQAAANQRLPRVDLGGTLGYAGRDRTLDSAAGSTFDGNAYNWEVDLTLNVPWGLREGRSRLRTSKLTLEQQKVRLGQLEQDLLVRVRAAVRAVQTDIQSIDIAALSTELSTREYELEKAKFDSGLSTSRLVVEAQQRKDEAQLQETETRVRLKQDVARLRRIEGGSLDRYGIDVLKE